MAKPEVKVGDSWSYRRMDYGRNAARETYRLHVTFAGRDAIHVVVTGTDGRESDASFTSEWNDVVSPGGRINTRARGELQFPLRPGAAYKLDWVAAESGRSDSGRHLRSVNVVGWEEIAVPAGRFHALRVESVGSYQRFGGDHRSLVRDVFWYVPNVKRWVKHSSEFTHFTGRRSVSGSHGEELMDFSVQ